MQLRTLASSMALLGLASTSFAKESELPSKLVRLATVPLGAEITGLELSPQGELFFNAQHPSDTLPVPFNRATVGVLEGVNFNNPESLNFEALAVPQEQAKLVVNSALGSYRVLFNGGDSFSKPGFPGIGSILDSTNEVVLTESNDPDFNSFIPVDENSGYLFTNWEDRPGGMSRVKIIRDELGGWSVDSSKPEYVMNVDFSKEAGTWVNCFGTTTPWMTPLTAEELYWDETAEWNDASASDHDGVANLAEHLGRYPNPYRYGFNVEITKPVSDKPQPVKRFALGRFSHENAVVMPDQKTVYQSDDGTDVVFFKFVADKAADLSSGTLYAAKMIQDAGSKAADTAGFDVKWIRLGSNNDAAIEAVVKSFDDVSIDDFLAGSSSYITDDQIATWAMKLKASKELTDLEKAIPFLETRKAAKALGATAEFRKMEGVNINLKAAASGKVPYMYMAMSEVSKGMSDDKGDIQLEENKCGVVYRMKLDEQFDVSRMEPALAGGSYDSSAGANRCPVGSISNPDNILVLNNGWVIIGEDTGNHENNMLWLLK